jgi:hypothetical protein
LQSVFGRDQHETGRDTVEMNQAREGKDPSLSWYDFGSVCPFHIVDELVLMDDKGAEAPCANVLGNC